MRGSWWIFVEVTTTVTSMASLTRKPRSKYWFACFRDVNGKQRPKINGTHGLLAASPIVRRETASRRRNTGRPHAAQGTTRWQIVLTLGDGATGHPSKRIKDAQSPVDQQSILKILR